MIDHGDQLVQLCNDATPMSNLVDNIEDEESYNRIYIIETVTGVHGVRGHSVRMKEGMLASERE